MRFRFAVVGLGRVGSVMLALLSEAGHVPVWVVTSKDKDCGAEIHRRIPDGPRGAHLVFLAVPDGAIGQTAREIAQRWGVGCRGVVFFHFSGLLTADELRTVADQGGLVGSLHPLQAIVDVEQARHGLKESVFTFEGSDGAWDAAQVVSASLGAVLLRIDASQKPLYHASAVVASNYLVTILHQASCMIRRAGMDLDHLMGLVRGTVANVARHGASALTGPVARADWGTVRAHVEALSRTFPDILPSYLALAGYASRMAGVQMPADLAGVPCPIGLDDLAKRLEAARSRGMKIVFTNGCFDILHAGHVSYLKKARALGDCLVVGLNADDSVKRLKGPGRPVNPASARAAVLGALSCVDYVVIFEEDTPLGLIERVRPDVLVKGGDWEGREIVGAAVVEGTGGRVVTMPYEDGFSTTGLIERLRSG